MKKTVCPFCGMIMLDDDRSIRFACSRCHKMFKNNWEKELHDQLTEAMPDISKEKKDEPTI